MSTMKAITILEHGGPEILRLHEHPVPQPGPGEVRVRMKATALNHLDLWMRQGIETFPIHFPRILGSDGAGVVDTVGEGVTDWSPGDEVMMNPAMTCGTCEHCRSGEDLYCDQFTMRGEHVDGLGAQFVVMPARNLARKPAHLSFEEAATMPVIFLTAQRMVVTLGQPRPGQWVVVQGATGGIGLAAVQIAKAQGARVLAVSRKEEASSLLKDLGADEVVHTQDDMLATLKRVAGKARAALVVEHVGKATWSASLRALGVGGRVVTCGATSGHKVEVDLRHLFFKHQRILGSTMGTMGEFHAVVQRIAGKTYRPVVDKVFAMDEAAQAHAYLESAGQMGKVVIRIGV